MDGFLAVVVMNVGKLVLGILTLILLLGIGKALVNKFLFVSTGCEYLGFSSTPPECPPGYEPQVVILSGDKFIKCYTGECLKKEKICTKWYHNDCEKCGFYYTMLRNTTMDFSFDPLCKSVRIVKIDENGCTYEVDRDYFGKQTFTYYVVNATKYECKVDGKKLILVAYGKVCKSCMVSYEC